ncbi:DNA repair protein RecO [Clostridium beijerinckii]|jgi:DNA replication and repair protein RecO|uniref:DNA repair protein RecO n=2 Tax=Clostridium beijerinckii TaxID=1520 RepID=A0A1S8P9L9_CLOBE|nr:DNA repair protein RecO [Clostridium beijerinckii]ABR33030.1 DNA repair protein RecO [Clostridium beijerinckii NCIMB 8052]AIU00361.1 DNA repair protein RecO [Clostridium beijerinckii ATCC 35702]AQS03456.1 DNA repair protein RecO [Clostridium beijerinckii]MBA2884710.1 DNA repair protein RecO (recombination protein O) [Clostridium beijerinckii]MBA2899432.1 DNA repair protein RecO (recombination protein O) [Clostridium beijerinckii]
MVDLSIVETKAVIIKTQDFKENDKLVWFYTEKLGKITAIVRGAKKSKSKFLALTLPLCYGEYMVYKGKSLYTLQEGKIIQSFQGLLNDLHKLTYSSYLCELIDIACTDNEINMELFKTLITTLYLLNTDALDYELLIRAFELRLLKTTGYNLTLNNCSVCRKKISSSNYISLSHYGGICDECPKEHGVFISKGAYNALRFLMNMDIDKLYRLNLNNEIKSEIEKVITFLVSNSYAKKPKSLEMLKFIKE